MSAITKHQTYWSDPVLADAALEGTIVAYVTLHNLKTKDIYQWKTALTKRGFFPIVERKVARDFVAVNTVEQADSVELDTSYSVQCRRQNCLL